MGSAKRRLGVSTFFELLGVLLQSEVHTCNNPKKFRQHYIRVMFVSKKILNFKSLHIFRYDIGTTMKKELIANLQR